MKLQKLSLTNFKGIREFTIETNGNDMAIYGDNGTGKTTMADAWFWLLFGKDSLNRSDFEIKTLDSTGQPLHNLSHEVEAAIEVNGRQVTLKKVYAEKWTKKRGNPTPEFTSHTTEHYIDGVPKPANQYKDAIDSIAGREETFKLLTNPRQFAEVIKWQDRRRILMEICGDVSDAEVIASNTELASLPDILGKRKLDDQKKVIAGQRTTINNALKMIPARIDEVQRGLPQAGMTSEEQEIAQLKIKMDDLRAQRQKAEWSLTMVSSGGGVAEKTTELRKIEARIQELENEHQKAVNAADQGTDKKLRELANQAATLKDTIARLTRKGEQDSKEVFRLDTGLAPLRQKFMSTSALEFEYQGADTCPTCGQPLPEDQVEAAKAKALAAFNQEKARALENIQAEGKRQKAILDELQAGIIKSEAERDQAIGKKIAIQQEIEATPTQEKQAIPYPPEYQEQIAAKAAILRIIDNLKADRSQEAEGIKQSIGSLNEEIARVESEIAQVKARESGLKRIDELGAEEKRLAAEFEELERQLYLCDQFTRTKVQMLDEKINSRFKIARFKMFNQNINGGIEECCELTVNGVPYGGGLNNGMKIQVGMDVIRTLQAHYGFNCPVWVDNRESVTSLPEMDCQLISLFVSEKDKALRVETA